MEQNMEHEQLCVSLSIAAENGGFSDDDESAVVIAEDDEDPRSHW